MIRPKSEMKKVFWVLALCAAAVACQKQEAAAPVDTAAKPAVAAAPADAAATPAAAIAANLPKECADYLTRVKACIGKSSGNAAAAQFQTALDQSKAQWEAATDKAALVPACKQASDQFNQMASMMKCE